MIGLLLYRPPLNLLRQELAGASVYLDILQKTTSDIKITDAAAESNISENGDSDIIKNEAEKMEDEKLKAIAEEKLVAFCEQVLREASEFQSSIGDTVNMDIHRVLELRSPIVVKVNNIFFHPYFSGDFGL